MHISSLNFCDRLLQWHKKHANYISSKIMIIKECENQLRPGNIKQITKHR